jgi:mRNA interferase RelE/StbE
MNKWSLVYTKQSLDDLKPLDKKLVQRIFAKIKENSELSNPLIRAKALSGALAGTYRYRIGDYRAIFRCDSSGTLVILTILRIKHRKEIYE